VGARKNAGGLQRQHFNVLLSVTVEDITMTTPLSIVVEFLKISYEKLVAITFCRWYNHNSNMLLSQ
jgi:hypothetical protein